MVPSRTDGAERGISLLSTLNPGNVVGVPSQLTLSPHPRSAARARAWITSQLRAIDRYDLIESAELGVSELVTNAIIHARTPILVTLVVTSGQVRIEVQDGSANRPKQGRNAGGDVQREPSSRGRGITIVESLASEWGIRIDHLPGKTVWFAPSPAVSQQAEGPPAEAVG
jgi:anti-sigma regulatory factor (Ser/Thr protein kinase)